MIDKDENFPLHSKNISHLQNVIPNIYIHNGAGISKTFGLPLSPMDFYLETLGLQFNKPK